MIKIENNEILFTIFNRVIVYRNIENYPFCKNLDNDKRKRLEEEIINYTLDNIKDVKVFHTNLLKSYEKTFFIEKNIDTRSFFEGKNNKFLYLPNEDLYIILNSDNHLKFVISSDISLKEQYKTISTIENLFNQRFKFYFSSKYGFLTQNVKNCGLGLKLSVLLHIPGIVINNKDNSIFKDLSKKGYYLRLWKKLKENNFYYLVTSKLSFGLSEEKLIDRFNIGIMKLMEMEKKYFLDYYNNNKENIDDIIHKSYGILKYSKKIGYEDTLYLLSNLFFGIQSDFNLSIKKENINRIITKINDGYIAINNNFDEENLEKIRAEMIKNNLFME